MLSIIRFEDPIWRQPGAALPDALKDADALFRPPAGCLLLAYDPDTQLKILGSAGFVRVTNTVCEARRVVVHWDYQHKGIGSQLMTALLNEAKNVGYTGIRAQLPDNVPPLVAFFERFNFQRSPREFQAPGQVRLERML